MGVGRFFKKAKHFVQKVEHKVEKLANSPIGKAIIGAVTSATGLGPEIEAMKTAAKVAKHLKIDVNKISEEASHQKHLENAL